MLFTEWLDAESGRARRIADHFGVTASAVSQWRRNGAPADYLLTIHELTEKSVSLEELLRERAGREPEAA